MNTRSNRMKLKTLVDKDVGNIRRHSVSSLLQELLQRKAEMQGVGLFKTAVNSLTARYTWT